jgi:acyl-CoA thioesterase I
MKAPWLWLLGLLLLVSSPAEAETRILVLGDSLTAGYGLSLDQAFPAQLETVLSQRGHSIKVFNAGISGDTSAGGAARLAWSLSDQPDIVIIELGANDALRGLSPQQTEANLTAIIKQVKQKNIVALLTGMKAPRNLGASYYNSFDQLYPALAKQFTVAFYPFFLEGVAGVPDLNQSDGIHPNPDGVKVIVKGILPVVEGLL